MCYYYETSQQLIRRAIWVLDDLMHERSEIDPHNKYASIKRVCMILKLIVLLNLIQLKLPLYVVLHYNTGLIMLMLSQWAEASLWSAFSLAEPIPRMIPVIYAL